MKLRSGLLMVVRTFVGFAWFGGVGYVCPKFFRFDLSFFLVMSIMIFTDCC